MKALEHLDRNMPILVVEDFPRMRHIMKNCLAKLGFKNITEAEDGLSACEKLAQQEFKLIISDLQMPNMAGTELLEHIRNSDQLRHIPFILVTAPAQQAEGAVAAAASSDAESIVKPFTPGQLEERLDTLFA